MKDNEQPDSPATDRFSPPSPWGTQCKDLHAQLMAVLDPLALIIAWGFLTVKTLRLLKGGRHGR
jgi:hypothetical protein